MPALSKPFSYSKIATYKQCPKKYFWNYIFKAPKKQTDITALLKGGAVHSMLEVFPDKSTHKLAPKYQHIADNFIDSDIGKKYLLLDAENEFRFGLDKDLKPCEYSDKSAIFRGIIDYICVLDIIHLIDWKTGKYRDQKWQNYDQLMYYAIYFFQRYPKIDSIKISYVYVEHMIENDIVLERKYLTRYTNELVNSINDITTDQEFVKSPSRLCDWCDIQDYCSKN